MFSKIHQIPIALAEVLKTAVITSSGLFEFLRMSLDSAKPPRHSGEFLIHLVDSNDIQSLPSMFAAIRDFTPAASKRQLRRFLAWLISPACSSRTILPLTSLLSGPKGSFELSAYSFDKVEAVLADATLLTYFLPVPTNLSPSWLTLPMLQ
ncbi:hypothetical protein SprV_0200952600 [Sparganum proliferum]